MGMDTLVNGPKGGSGGHGNGHGNGRRGDIALVIGILLGALEGYRAMAGQPANAAPAPVVDAEVSRRLGVLEEQNREFGKQLGLVVTDVAVLKAAQKK